MNGKKQIITLSFWGIISIMYTIIGGLTSVLILIISLIFYIVFTYLLYLTWKKIRKKPKRNILQYGQIFLYKSALIVAILGSMIGGFTYYNNEISPAKMPTYFISNGEKQVIFQAMIHIAHPDFYSQIRSNIRGVKQDGYVYFFEGVKPGTPENTKNFNEALGIEFNPELYKNFSKLYGVTPQDQASFLGIENNLDFNVDMNLDEIMKLYNQSQYLKQGTQNNTETKTPININDDIISQLAELSDTQLKILVYFNQAILNFFTKNETLRNTIIEKIGNQDIFTVILHDRNQLLADEIIASKHDKIYITYGLLHFDGVLEILKSSDENWKIENVEYLFPIQ